MSGDDGNSGDIAPTFEEQIRHLRKLRGSKGTLFEKTTEHNVAKKLVRELTKSHPQPVVEEHLDQRLQQTLNREAETDMYAMFDSITASITGFKRRETKTFRAPVPPSEDAASTPASAGSGSDSAPNTAAHNPAPRLVARATKKYQIYVEGGQAEIRAASEEQVQPNTSLPSKEEEMVLGEARAKQADDGPGEEEFIVGGNATSRTGRHKQIRTFPGGTEQEVHTPGVQQRPEVRPTAEHGEIIQKNEPTARSGQEALAPISDAAGVETAARSGQDARAPVDSNFSGAASDTILTSSVSAPPRDGRFEFDTEFIQEMALFTAQTGLDLVVNSLTTMQVTLTAGGTTTTLHEVPLNDNGIEEARILASSLLNYYLVSLRNDFNVDFGHFGETATHQWGLNEKNQLVPIKALFARPPRLDELKAVHAALEYSWPASAQADEQVPLKILFVNDELVKGDDVGARLKFGDDGRPILFITPALCGHGASTEKDVFEDSSESWQLTIMRELAWKTLADCKKLPLSTEDCESLGWIEVSRNDGLYILATTGGEYFYPNPDPQNPGQAWLKVNKSGEYVNENEQKVASSSEIIFKSAEEIALAALIPPPGVFFHSPEEELADALCRFRLGEKNKAAMLKRSPAVYRLAKEVDQDSINRWYVPTKNYSGVIRAASGALIDHSKENLDQILKFEQNARHS